jgi:hypothetical protein
MIFGFVFLDSILEFVKQNPEIPDKEEAIFRAYRRCYEGVVGQLPILSGWYIWVKLNHIQRPEIIYVGKSETKTTSNIRARLTETFFDEASAFWASYYDPNNVLEIICKKNMVLYGREYRKENKRSIRKRNANLIIWIGNQNLSKSDILLVEKNLIFYFQPTANTQGKKSKPQPSDMATEVIQIVKEQIINLKRPSGGKDKTIF